MITSNVALLPASFKFVIRKQQALIMFTYISASVLMWLDMKRSISTAALFLEFHFQSSIKSVSCLFEDDSVERQHSNAFLCSPFSVPPTHNLQTLCGVILPLIVASLSTTLRELWHCELTAGNPWLSFRGNSGMKKLTSFSFFFYRFFPHFLIVISRSVSISVNNSTFDFLFGFHNLHSLLALLQVDD